MILQSHSWAYIQRKIWSKRIHAPNINCSAVYNSQDMESTEQWIKKMWYIYTMEHYLAIKKNEIMPFAATWMDLEIIILSEVKSERERQIPYVSLIC